MRRDLFDRIKGAVEGESEKFSTALCQKVVKNVQHVPQERISNCSNIISRAAPSEAASKTECATPENVQHLAEESTVLHVLHISRETEGAAQKSIGSQPVVSGVSLVSRVSPIFDNRSEEKKSSSFDDIASRPRALIMENFVRDDVTAIDLLTGESATKRRRE